MKLTLFTDGASQGNPGPSAIGVVIKNSSGKSLATISESIGNTTNNQAEYQAIIAALEKAIELGARQVKLFSDSELLVMQITGRYRVKAAALRPLYLKVKQLESTFDKFDIIHIPREQNKEADRLCNEALK